jgi:L-2-hydroxyglutarate oxidase
MQRYAVIGGGTTVRSPSSRSPARQHRRTGLAEVHGSLRTRAFTAAARRDVPELTDDVLPGPAGTRAQALDPDGGLVDDVRFWSTERVLVVRGDEPAGAGR